MIKSEEHAQLLIGDTNNNVSQITQNEDEINDDNNSNNNHNALDQFLYDSLSKTDSNNIFNSYFETPTHDQLDGNNKDDSMNHHNGALQTHNTGLDNSANIDEMEIDTILNNFTVSAQNSRFGNHFIDGMNLLGNDSNEDHSSSRINEDSISSATSVTADNNNSNDLETTEAAMDADMQHYEKQMEELNKLKFGGFSINDEELKNPAAIKKQIPPTLYLPNDSLAWDPELDYASKSADDKLPFKIKIGSLPDFSRVETQIKVDLMIHPKPKDYLVRLPTDLISKKKFCLKNGVDALSDDVKNNILHLDCFVVGEPLAKDANGKTSSEAADQDLKLDGLFQTEKFKSCNICSKCIKRELKRASRRKNGLSEDGLNWIDVIPKKAIIFNSKEIVSLPPPTSAQSKQHSNLSYNGFRINSQSYGFSFLGFGNSGIESASDKQQVAEEKTHEQKSDEEDVFNEQNSSKLELSARIVCYCRHHQSQKGFKLLFVLRNNKGEIVGKNFSRHIMIMDRKKAMDAAGQSSAIDANAEAKRGSVSGKRAKSVDINPITPPSLDDDSSDHRTSDSKSIKRTKLSGSSQPSAVTNRYLNSRNSSSTKINSDFNSFVNNIYPAHDYSLGLNNNFSSNFSNPSNSNRPSISIDANSLSPLSDNAVSSSTAYRSPGDSGMLTSFTSLSSPNFVKADNHGANAASSVNGAQITGQATSVTASQLVSPTVTSLITPSYAPTIQKVIPSEGPIRGGIEITLLGINFKPGLKVKFGDVKALGTHCWSDSTVVTFLPPASKPGQVLVSFEANEGNNELNEQFRKHEHSQIFTYTDDTDRQLIELALQIVGMKMNGKLEDARNIARRIVGNDSFDKGDDGSAGMASSTTKNTQNSSFHDNTLKDFYDTGEEDLLLRLISVCDLPNAPSSPNWQICTKEKQTMLHLSCFKGLPKVTSALINRGARVNCKDINGFTPLHFAALGGHSKVVKMLFKAKANPNIKNNFGKSAFGVSDNLQVRALIRELENRRSHADNDSDNLAKSSYGISRSLSSNSISSLSSLEEDDLRYHVSKMVVDCSQNNDIKHDINSDDAEENQVMDPSESDNADDEGDNADNEDIHSTNLARRYKHNHNFYHSHRTSDKTNVNGNDDSVESATCGNADDDLPKYDDLYPHGDPAIIKQSQLFASETTENSSMVLTSSVNRNFELLDDGNGHASNQIQSAEVETRSEESSQDERSEDGNDSDSSQENMFKYYMYFSEKNKATKFSNDKMLLFFWVPLLIVIASFYIYSQFAGIESLNKYGEEVVNYIREGLYQLMLGKERMEGLINDQLNILTMDNGVAT